MSQAPGSVPAPEAAPHQEWRFNRELVHVTGFALFALGFGGLAGLAWWGLVDLPGYLVGSDGTTNTTERGLTEFISGDAWFSVIGLVGGIALGLLAWWRFRRMGWPVVLIGVVSAFLAALVCWLVGWELGPGAFEPRLAAAMSGQFVPIELTLRARASLIVWPFAASIPILLASSLGREDEEPTPIFRRREP